MTRSWVLRRGDQDGRVVHAEPDEDRVVLRSGVWVYVVTGEDAGDDRRFADAKWP